MVKMLSWPGAIGWLGALLVVLRLSGLIEWSWWIVTAPIWVPVAFIVAVGLALDAVSWAFD